MLGFQSPGDGSRHMLLASMLFLAGEGKGRGLDVFPAWV